MTSRSHNLDSRGDAPAVSATALPQRHQRSRRKGTKTPEGVVYVGRPTIFGNPFTSKRFGHARSIALYRLWVDYRLGARSLQRLGFSPNEIDALTRWRKRLAAQIPQLTGRDLQCWCPLTTPLCHAETLIELAARENQSPRTITP